MWKSWTAVFAARARVLGILLAVAALVAAYVPAPALSQEPPAEPAGRPAPGQPAADDQAVPPEEEGFAEEGFSQEEGFGGGAGFESSVDEEDFAAIEDLLRQDDALRSDPGAYTYDPGSRRDPFRSLIVQRERPEENQADRPDGIAGLLIDELQIEGVFELPEGPVAQVNSASHETSHLIRPGDQLWDGDVVSITLEEVVFKQSVTDETALKPFQLVVKRLNP